jgi:hypothetical protein
LPVLTSLAVPTAAISLFFPVFFVLHFTFFFFMVLHERCHSAPAFASPLGSLAIAARPNRIPPRVAPGEVQTTRSVNQPLRRRRHGGVDGVNQCGACER